MSTETQKRVNAILVRAFAKLPKRLDCPKCDRNREKKFFGLRVLARDAKGVPTRVYRQSYCVDCRNP